MLLTHIQELLGGIYDVRIAHDVYDFLVTDRGRLPGAARRGTSEEELLVAHEPERDELSLALYLDPALLERLRRADPFIALHGGNLADCLTALEGVSHFVYLAFNAAHDKPVSLLELELQAEVDKFVASYCLLRRQVPGHFPHELPRLLFERAKVDPRLDATRAGLYREASRYAQRFCRHLERALARSRVDLGADAALLAELRRFYRLNTVHKRAHIERTA